MRASPRVLVTGVSGAGKTTIGQRLAGAMEIPFLEGDDLHPSASIAKMSGGLPLTDADRGPWLAAIGAWLAAQPGGGVASCSALKRAYRDSLREQAPDAFCVFLQVQPDVVRERVSSRSGHFMPASLVDSQLAGLEPLEPTESGITLDAGEPVAALVEASLRAITR